MSPPLLIPLKALVKPFANILNFSRTFYIMRFVCSTQCYGMQLKAADSCGALVSMYVNIWCHFLNGCNLNGQRRGNLKRLTFPAVLESYFCTGSAPLIYFRRGKCSLHSLNVPHILLATAARKCYHNVIRVTVTRHFTLVLLPTVRCQ
jgi:hypothetical protein